jgi:hypothetical protein
MSNIISQFHMPGRKDESTVPTHNVESCSICQIMGRTWQEGKYSLKEP